MNKPQRPIHYLDKSRRRRWPRVAAIGGAGLLVLVLAAVVAIEAFAITPRTGMQAVLQFSSHLPPAIAAPVRWVANIVLPQDRLNLASATLPAGLGADPSAATPGLSGSRIPVADMDGLRAATEAAHPGDVIVIAPGRYHIDQPSIRLSTPGTDDAPITLMAARLGDVVMDSDTTVALHADAPHWRIENLVIRGVCSDDSRCEHAIQVTGAASDTQIRNNRLENFNAQIKINGDNGVFPDHGLIEGNTLIDTAPRATHNPIAAIDLVAASDWRIDRNIIADFQRSDDSLPSYGAYAKGAGEHNILERNLVICEWKLHQPGEHIGLSLGGGGTDPKLTRDLGRTGFEQIGGVVRNNLVAGCSDDGIYLNRSARSEIDHNTLIDTSGVDARFIETSATVIDNIIDGTIRTRSQASTIAQGNDTPSVWGLFLGLHPQRAYFTQPASLDLTWRAEPAPAAVISQALDLCGASRTATAPPGAFVDYKRCLTASASVDTGAAGKAR